jgi:hypothetical protein
MFEIQKDQTTPVNFFAGEFPIVTEVGDVAEGKTVRKYAPVSLTDNGVEEAAEATIDNLCGIAAADSTDGGVVYYMTGEFFADALVLPDGVTAEALKPAFRKLGIFLK